MNRNDSNKSAYLNPELPVTQQVQDLLSQMTLREKVAQMLCVWQGKTNTLVYDNGNSDLDKAKAHFGYSQRLGQVGRPSNAGAGKSVQASLIFSLSTSYVKLMRTKDN